MTYKITTHPGKILLEEFMKPYNIDHRTLADRLLETEDHIHYITSGQKDVSTKLAFKLGKFFNTTPEFWLNLQINHNVSFYKDNINDFSELQDIIPL